ncbi:hypothetical protein [Paracidobacterium acidisoli]|uniref:Uncharacterized protein n=1 Tax=Paracidobacterium acidisoli TaxID=2303751 RepID=A0A372IIL0_9BACT|nr:hypothetical protein [Paracidobacterium acidisoli]MBT9333381.1 hypothetical protein [Paracidobacterium acidisoli]
MTAAGKLRIAIPAIHGSLALLLGLTLLYLHAAMSNPLFEALAVGIAILLSAAALILAAITDWFAALTAGMKKLHRVTFYLLAGIAFALAGIFLGAYPLVPLQWLVIFAIIHALAFGISALAYAARAGHHSQKRRAMYFFGAVSILFSGAMAGLIRNPTDSSATAILGWYLCFVGAKMLFFAWEARPVRFMPDSPRQPEEKDRQTRSAIQSAADRVHTQPAKQNAHAHHR